MTKSRGASWGGSRSGAGRKKSKTARPAREIAPVTTDATVSDVEALAKSHTTLAVRVLADIAQNGEKEAARVAAANSLLDRGHGKIGGTASEGKKAERQSKAEKVSSQSRFAPRPGPRLAVDNS